MAGLAGGADLDLAGRAAVVVARGGGGAHFPLTNLRSGYP